MSLYEFIYGMECQVRDNRLNLNLYYLYFKGFQCVLTSLSLRYKNRNVGDLDTTTQTTNVRPYTS